MTSEIRFPDPAQFELPELPDFLTSHIDPFTGENDARTPGSEAMLGAMGAGMGAAGAATAVGDPYAGQGLSRNAPCPCGSGEKYKHCHGSAG